MGSWRNFLSSQFWDKTGGKTSSSAGIPAFRLKCLLRLGLGYGFQPSQPGLLFSGLKNRLRRFFGKSRLKKSRFWPFVLKSGDFKALFLEKGEKRVIPGLVGRKTLGLAGIDSISGEIGIFHGRALGKFHLFGDFYFFIFSFGKMNDLKVKSSSFGPNSYEFRPTRSLRSPGRFRPGVAG